jgi:hypothetical protein
MKISDKLYVGFERDRYAKDEDPRILGFAVPYDDTKSSKNRQRTVDGWRQKDIDARTIENKPRKFFKIVDSVVRNTTSNKLFRVLDPNGFELEISAENLLRVIEDCTIANGTILDECIWTHVSGGRIYLLPTSAQEYKLHIDSSKRDGKMKQEAGGLYISDSNGLSVFRFEGIFQHTYLDWAAQSTKEKEEPDSYTGRYNTWNSGHGEVIVQEYEVNVDVLMNSGKKPSYVYTEFMLDSHGNVDRSVVIIRKGLMKLASEYGGDVMDEMKQPFDPMQFINHVQYYFNYADRTKDYKIPDTLSTNASGDFIGLFKDKKDALAFDYTSIINSIKPEKSKITTIRSSQRSNQSHSYYDRYNTFVAVTEPSKYNITDKRK